MKYILMYRLFKNNSFTQTEYSPHLLTDRWWLTRRGQGCWTNSEWRPTPEWTHWPGSAVDEESGTSDQYEALLREKWNVVNETTAPFHASPAVTDPAAPVSAPGPLSKSPEGRCPQSTPPFPAEVQSHEDLLVCILQSLCCFYLL